MGGDIMFVCCFLSQFFTLSVERWGKQSRGSASCQPPLFCRRPNWSVMVLQGRRHQHKYTPSRTNTWSPFLQYVNKSTKAKVSDMGKKGQRRNTMDKYHQYPSECWWSSSPLVKSPTRGWTDPQLPKSQNFPLGATVVCHTTGWHTRRNIFMLNWILNTKT